MPLKGLVSVVVLMTLYWVDAPGMLPEPEVASVGGCMKMCLDSTALLPVLEARGVADQVIELVSE